MLSHLGLIRARVRTSLGGEQDNSLSSSNLDSPIQHTQFDKAAAWSRLLLVEMFARLLKNQSRAEFRQTMELQRALGQEAFRQVAVRLVNRRLGRNPAADKFWCIL